MQLSLYIAAVLISLVCVAHSYLGERYILMRLFRRDNLPELFGSSEFTERTLRFAWHLTSVTWLGLAAVLVHIANPPLSISWLGNVIGFVFFVHFAIALVASRGKHLSWPVFLAVSILTFSATRSG